MVDRLEQLEKDMEQQKIDKKKREEDKIRKKADLWEKLKDIVTGEYAGKEEEFEAIDEIRKITAKIERLV